ncbi:MAG TPA: hypothetical protein VMI35_01900 [Puia sp.]|nr:hypothetical protein [Puia sp.]
MVPQHSKAGAINESRRIFTRRLGWISAVVLITPFLRFRSSKKTARISCSPGEEKKTVKMLTRDGKLVEIDQRLLASGGRKISNEELQKWIVRK